MRKSIFILTVLAKYYLLHKELNKELIDLLKEYGEGVNDLLKELNEELKKRNRLFIERK